MSRHHLLVLIVTTLAVNTPSALGSFLYLIPDTTSTGTFSVVFHSSPLTAPAESSGSLAVSTVTAVGEAGKRTQLPVETADRRTTAKGAGDTAFASVDFGVSNRGEGQLVLLRFHAKAQPVGGKDVGLSVELTPQAVSGGVVFVATAGGKPLPGATVTVHEPGSADPRTVTTDADGRTPAYSKAGRYAVKVGRFEKKKGEHEGKAFTGVWEYSTLVTDVK